MDSSKITSVFVYGTLQTGQCRQSMWPAVPVAVIAAWTRGFLFGRSDYPAMVAGGDRVGGQLWRFQPCQVSEVLKVLDEVECVPNLYRRVPVEVFSGSGDRESLGLAWTYLYAKNPLSDGFSKLGPRGEASPESSDQDTSSCELAVVRWPE